MKTIGKILALLSVFLAMPLLAQQATVTATISGYAGGNVVATFQPQGRGRPSRTQVSGTINSSGTFSLLAWNNSYAAYAPSTTNFQICIKSTCYSTPVSITSSSQDISSSFASAPSPPSSACATATTSVLGCVKPDGSTIQVTNGVISTNASGVTPTTLNNGSLPALATLVGTTAEFSNGTCTTSKSISAANGNHQNVTLTNADACALTFVQPSSGTITITLKIIQSSAGSFNGTITGGKWPGGSVPTITATSGAVDFISCYLDGTNTYCVASQNFS